MRCVVCGVWCAVSAVCVGGVYGVYGGVGVCSV